MKKTIAVLTLLVGSYANAGQTCGAYYAAGIGHVMSGEATQLGQLERINEGQTSQDEFYSVTVKNGQPELKVTKTGASVELASNNIGMQVYASRSLSLYPEGVPGTHADEKFIVILCAPEGSF